MKARAKEWQNERRALIASLKEGQPCAECGNYYPAVAMDWHHRDPAMKDKSFQKLGAGLERFMAEVAKCDLLCANCHRIKHHGVDYG